MKFEYFENELTTEELIDKLFEINENTKLIERPITFPSKNDAKEYLTDMSNKDKSFCVKYLAPLGDFNESQNFKEFNDKLENINFDILHFPKTLIKRLSEQKSNLKGCSNQDCKSNINKDYHSKSMFKLFEKLNEENTDLSFEEKNTINKKVLNCPICGNEEFIITETDHEQLKRFENRKNDILKKLNEEKIKFEVKSGTKTVTLIGIDIENDVIENDDKTKSEENVEIIKDYNTDINENNDNLNTEIKYNVELNNNEIEDDEIEDDEENYVELTPIKDVDEHIIKDVDEPKIDTDKDLF